MCEVTWEVYEFSDIYSTYTNFVSDFWMVSLCIYIPLVWTEIKLLGVCHCSLCSGELPLSLRYNVDIHLLKKYSASFVNLRFQFWKIYCTRWHLKIISTVWILPNILFLLTKVPFPYKSVVTAIASRILNFASYLACHPNILLTFP
jgi:hypothetical protein